MIILGDFHVYPYGEFSRGLDEQGETPLSKVILDTAAWIRDLVMQEWTDSPLLLSNGDLTTTPGYMDAASLHLLAQVAHKWAGLPQVHNLGNHDRSAKFLSYHNLELHALLGVAVVDPATAPRVFRLGCGYSLYVLPYTFTLDEQTKMLARIPDDAIVAVHYPIIGSRMTPDVAETNGLDQSLFDRFSLTIASHYHLPQLRVGVAEPLRVVPASLADQEVELPPGSILITGTPLPHTFGDTHTAYGAWQRMANGHLVFRLNPHRLHYRVLDVVSAESAMTQLPTTDAKRTALTLRGDATVLDAARQQLDSSLFYGVRYQAVRRAEHQDRLPVKDRQRVLDSVREYMLRYPPDLPPGLIEDYLRPVSEKTAVATDGGNLVFEFLHVENFLSWEQAELPLTNRGLVLVTGTNHDSTTADSNGSGKTALLEALPWVLFNKTFRGVTNDEVIRRGAPGCVVEVGFSVVGQGDYLARRSRKHPNFGTTVALFRRDGFQLTELSASTAKATNELITQTLDMDFDLFAILSFFGQGFETRFSCLGDLGRKRLLEAIVGLSQYDRMKEIIDEDVRSGQRTLAEVQARLDTRRTFVASLEQQRELLLRAGTQREEAIRGRLQSLAIEIEQGEEEVKCLEEQRLFAQQIADELARESGEGIGAARLLEERVRSARSLLATHAQRVADLQQQQRATKDRISKLTGSYESISVLCPTCRAPLAADKIDAIRRQKSAEIEAEVTALKTGIAHLEVAHLAHEESRRHLDSAETELLHSQDNTERDRIEQEVADSTQNLRKAEEECKRAYTKQAALRAEQQALEAEDPLAGLDNIDGMLRHEKQQLQVIEDEHGVAKDRGAVLATVSEIFGPKALRSFMLDEGVGRLNTNLASVGAALGGDFSVQINSITTLKSGREDNSLSVALTTSGASYDSASGGERRKVDLALHLALSQLATETDRGSTNLLVADEVMDSLDASAAKAALSCLHTVAQSKSVFLVSHSPSLAGQVEDVLRVEKRGGVSSLGN